MEKIAHIVEESRNLKAIVMENFNRIYAEQNGPEAVKKWEERVQRANGIVESKEDREKREAEVAEARKKKAVEDMRAKFR